MSFRLLILHKLIIYNSENINKAKMFTNKWANTTLDDNHVSTVGKNQKRVSE